MTNQQDLMARLLEMLARQVVPKSDEDTIREAAAQVGRAGDEQPIAEVGLSDDGYKIGYLLPLRTHRLPVGTKLYLRPQLLAGVPEYDRGRIAAALDRMCEIGEVITGWTNMWLREQSRRLRAADNRDAEGVHTAKREPSPNWCRTCGKHWDDPKAVFCSDGIHIRPFASQPDNKESR